MSLADALAALPPKLSARHRTVYAEPTTAELIETCRAHLAARDAALKGFSEWAKAHGAVSFLVPPAWGAEDHRPAIFLFAPAPSEPGWRQARSVRRRREGNPYTFGKGEAGKALKASLDALPAIPNDRRIFALVGAPGGFSYTYDGGRGSASVGFSDGKVYFETLSELDGRFFVGFPNPFFDIARYRDTAEYYPGLEIDPEVLAWRPPEGWQLHTRAEVELLYAQARVAAEAEAA